VNIGVLLNRTTHNLSLSIHNIDDGIKEPTQPVSDVDTWKVSKDDIIFVFRGSYLGQYVPSSNHVDSRANYLFIKVLGWHVDPPGVQNKNILKYMSRL
jgi:hypothetical protein